MATMRRQRGNYEEAVWQLKGGNVAHFADGIFHLPYKQAKGIYQVKRHCILSLKKTLLFLDWASNCCKCCFVAGVTTGNCPWISLGTKEHVSHKPLIKTMAFKHSNQDSRQFYSIIKI